MVGNSCASELFGLVLRHLSIKTLRHIIPKTTLNPSSDTGFANRHSHAPSTADHKRKVEQPNENCELTSASEHSRRTRGALQAGESLAILQWANVVRPPFLRARVVTMQSLGRSPRLLHSSLDVGSSTRLKMHFLA
jgi:hypothetical protein